MKIGVRPQPGKIENRGQTPIFLRIGAALAFIASAAFSFAQSTKAPTEWRYYDVDGLERRQIFDELRRKGPNGYHAHASWQVDYRYFNQTANGRCAVTDVRTTMTGSVIFPRWARRQGASPDLGARWDRYEAALRTHEEGHLEHGRELADRLVIELKKVPPAEDCATLDQRVRARFDTLLKQYNQKDLDYDARTNHGRSQGATF